MEANRAGSSTCRPQQSMGFPPPQRNEPLPCPRCDSRATKFCYYNNYNLSQPRYLCKSCRRYWTHGGTLRNVPVGGATRKISKKSRTASSCSVPSTSTALPTSSANPQSHMNSPPLLTLNSEASLGLSGFSYDFTPDFDHAGVGDFPEFSALPSDCSAWDGLALPDHPPNNLN